MFTEKAREGLCVYCRRAPIAHAWRPFCSERCKLQDLAKWADESYTVPGDQGPRSDQPDKAESESDS